MFDQRRLAFRNMYRVCDEKLSFVREMIQSSESYLQYDESREKDLQ